SPQLTCRQIGASTMPPRPRSRRTLAACTALVCAAALFSTGSVGTSEAATARPASLEHLRTQLASLYHQAEKATDDYNEAGERVVRQEHDIVTIARAIVAKEKQVKALRDTIGAFARAQYRTGGMPVSPAAQLLLSRDPDDYLDRMRLTEKGAG